MKGNIVLVFATILAVSAASSSSASQTTAVLSSKYTGWSTGTGVYWYDDQGDCSDTSDSLVGHSPGVCFSLTQLPESAWVDLTVTDETEELELGPLSGQYVFKGIRELIKEIYLEPIDYRVQIQEQVTLASGRFCGSELSVPVPEGALELFVWADDRTFTGQWACSELNPGTTGIVTARFWTN